MSTSNKSRIARHHTQLAAALLGAAAMIAAAAPANAVSASVRRACMSDYFAHCSSHAVGSPGVRQCMRAAGPKLSRGCIDALVDAGEVSGKEVKRRAADLR